MNLRSSVTGGVVFSILMVSFANGVNAQERADARARESRNRINQLEEVIHKYAKQREEISAALEQVQRKERPDKFEQLLARRNELDAAIENVKNEFAAIREQNQDREQERNPRRRSRQRDANELVKQFERHSNQLKEINGWLEKNRGEEFAEKREQLMANRKELMAAILEIKTHHDEIQREREVVRKRKQEQDNVHPEIRAAMNQLEHLEHAEGHLREAGITEIAEMVEQRADKIREGVARYRKSRERGEQERQANRDQPRRERGNSDEAFRKEVTGAIRELGSAVRSLQKEIAELKKRDR